MFSKKIAKKHLFHPSHPFLFCFPKRFRQSSIGPKTWRNTNAATSAAKKRPRGSPGGPAVAGGVAVLGVFFGGFCRFFDGFWRFLSVFWWFLAVFWWFLAVFVGFLVVFGGFCRFFGGFWWFLCVSVCGLLLSSALNHIGFVCFCQYNPYL